MELVYVVRGVLALSNFCVLANYYVKLKLSELVQLPQDSLNMDFSFVMIVIPHLA